MECNKWGIIKTAWVEPFYFDSKTKNELVNIIGSFFESKESLDLFINGLQYSVECHLVSIDTGKCIKDREKVTAELNKVVNGLTKTISTLRSLDGVTQATLSQNIFLSGKELTGTAKIESWNADPTQQLEIMLHAAKCQLEEIREERPSRNNSPIYLVKDIVRQWREYALDGRKITNVKFAFRDFERNKNTPKVTLWHLVRIVLACAGCPKQDPSNYINEAIKDLSN
ncbi:MAG: hypothetical protein JKY76_04005 [Proteobacteria bacterium]|nr:hypothetical protein [Pseudomonadota bacterium]